MERGKTSSSGRGGKSKAPQHPQDIFALGSKSTVVVSREAEKRNIHKPSTSGAERKRDASSFGTQPATKRSRIESPAEAVGGTSLEVDPVDLVPNVLQALDTLNSDKLLGLLTGSIRLLKSQRSKPDPILCMSMLYLTKIRPNMFAHDTVTQSLCTLLKREQGAAFKNKGNPLVFVLACNMLYAGHRENTNWPDTFIKVYIEDALNERWWVECSWCKCLVDNIVTAFNTKQPPSHLIPTDNTLGTMSPSGSGSPLMGSNEDDVDISEIEYAVYPRYSSSYETVEGLVLEAIKEQIQRRTAPDAIGKGFLKLLSATCGFPEIRMISASRLEAWLHSGKLWRCAQQLLAHVCVNADATGPTAARDHEVLAQLARLRLKTKPLQQAYLNCVREMVTESPALLRSVVTHTIYNELSNVRAPNNMAVLAALLQAQPVAAPQAMAETFHELVVRAEDYVRPLRALIRECVRGGRADAQALLPLARALAAPPHHEPQAEIRERAFNSLVELFCCCCLLTASHRQHLPEHRQQLALIQSAALGWLLDCAPLYKAHAHQMHQALNKIMFVEPAESYSKVDNWPPESERAVTYRVCCETPLPQTTLMRIIYIGLAKEIPIGPAEVFELVEQLVRRACALPSEDNPLQVDKLEIADYIFQLCQFHPPDNITLPAGYSAPALAITSLHWRGWLLLCMLAAHNPHGFAERAAAQYPTLRALIETCITGKPSIEWTTSAAETERAEAEKASVLQLETHLAAASNAKLPITEASSRLLSQLCVLDPLGPARRPPQPVLDALLALAASLRLARLLARQPSLLLSLVQRHGTRRAMPWLTQLLRHEKARLSVLPVQCLCEFLSAGGVGGAGAAGSGGLGAHVRRTMLDSAQGARAVLTYYMQRLAHTRQQSRRAARRGLKLVLCPNIDENTEMDYNADVSPDEWLEYLPTIRHWDAVRDEVATRILAACVSETCPAHVSAYIRALPAHSPPPRAPLELCQVLMERSTVMGHVLNATSGATEEQHRALHAITTILYSHMRKVYTEGTEEEEEPTEEDSATMPELITLQWSSRVVTLPLTVAHAHLKLLCYGPSMYDTNQEMYNFLESIWVGDESPTVLSPGGTDLLLPDWLRLQLVRSARPRPLAAGLRGLPAHRLALLVQTFGMPVPAMSALLLALDACPARSVCRINVERSYMQQLLRVQRARGARGGDALAHALQLTPARELPDDTLFNEDPLPPEPASVWDDIEPETPTSLDLEAVPSLLATVFTSATNFKGDADTAFTQLIALITSEMRNLPHQSCPFATLTSHWLQQNCSRAALKPQQCRALLRSMTTLHQLIAPLTDVLKSVWGTATPVPCAPQKVACEIKDSCDVTADASVEQLIAAFESTTPGTLEEVGNRIISAQDPQTVVDAISQLLHHSQQGKYDAQIKSEEGVAAQQHVLSRRGRGCGLLLDWLLELQKETVAYSDTQMRLMFMSGGAVWRAQLAALLAPRAAHRTLHACLARRAGEWSPRAVLDFAETMAGGAGSGAGRSRRAVLPDALRLDHQQLKVLIEYIGLESTQLEASHGEAFALEHMQRRVPLLLRCCSGDVLSLLPMHPKLRYLLHMRIPKLIECEADLEVPEESVCSAADTVAHALFTAHHSNKCRRMEAACRALVTRVRGAGARCMPLVGAMLRGTPARHQHALLHALLVLQPAGMRAHSTEIHNILDSFLSTMRGGRDTGAQHRVAAILRQYGAVRPGAAAALLRRHRDTAASIPALASLTNAEPPSSSYPPPAALLVLQKRCDPPQEIAAAMQELDAWAARRGGGWGGAECARQLLAAAAPQLSSSHACCRSAALALLPKLLPAVKDTKPGLLAVLECLDSDLPEVTASMLDKLPDILVGMPEQASRVLARVFELGVKSRQPVEQCLAKCVQTFNQQRGC